MSSPAPTGGAVAPHQRQFGTAPVFLTAISTILGTVLFLRLDYAVGNVGFVGVLLIIAIGHMVTIPTAMALAEIATNQRVEGGGEYFIMSRAFGVRIGAAIGMALFASQAISVAFYIIAFAESFEPAFEYLREHSGVTIADKRVISLPVLLLLTLLMFTRGAKIGVWAIYAVVSLVFAALASFFLGGRLPGAGVDFNPEMLTRTVEAPDPFFVVFAILFPAFTGMTAGVGLSGDLRDTRRSIPIGTLSATLVGMFVYIAVAYKLAIAVPPEILNDRESLVMSKVALWWPIIPIGLAAATLSSAIGSMLVAPRTLQALAADGAFPSPAMNRWLAFGRGQTHEPTHGTVIVAIIALAFVTIGGIDSVARIISLIFMVTYGSLCLISFLQHFAASPAYRPTFRSPWYVSLLGAGMCVWLMFRMSPGYAVLAILTMLALYSMLGAYGAERHGLASMFQGVIFQLSRQLHIFLQGHAAEREDVWHPSVVCVSDATFDRLAAFDLMRWISHRYGFGTYIHHIDGQLSRAEVEQSRAIKRRLLHMTGVAHGNVFVDTLISPSYTTAIAQAIQLPGFSGKANNMVLFEYHAKAPVHLAEIVDTYQMISGTDFDVAILASTDRAFGYRRDVHIWIKPGEFENARLMIMLAYIILGHPEWRRAEMRIFVLHPENEEEKNIAGLMDELRAGRLPIALSNIELIPLPAEVDKKDVISARSREADLTILGFQGELLRLQGAAVFEGYTEVGDLLFVNSNREHRVDLISQAAGLYDYGLLSDRVPDSAPPARDDRDDRDDREGPTSPPSPGVALAAALALALAVATAACRSAEPSARADVAGADEAPRYGAIALEACQLAAEGLALRLPAECGSLPVPENPAEPDGRSIELAVAVRRAVVRAKAPEPVFFLAGGPGQSAREGYVALASAFAPLRRRHDIILVDQRGTGASGALDCAGDGESTGDIEDVVRLDMRPATLTEQAGQCADDLEADGIDPSQYTTSRAIDDLEAVRAALGVERMNLVGASYGTRVAQAYAARYPERTRSLVLDGVVPLDRPLGGTAAADAQAALDAQLARCAADADCLAAFGPHQTWSPAALQARLAESPVTIEVRHPTDATLRRVDVTADVVALTVRLLLYGTETTSLMPLTLAAAAAGDHAPLAAQFLLVAGDLEAGISQGLNHSVACAEDVPRLAEPAVRAAVLESEAGTFMGDMTSASLAATCAAWPRGDVEADIVDALHSDVPALLISGQWDPVTPAAGAEHVLAGLSAGRHLVAPGQGHGVLGRGCMPDLVADFVEAGSAAAIDAGCLDTLTAAPFFTSFAGPRP